MASPNSLSRATVSSFSFLNFLRRSSCPKQKVPSMARFVTTTIPKNDTSYDDVVAAALAHADKQRRDDVFNKFNPVQSAGPKCPFESKFSKGTFYVRVDMPGVGADGTKVWVEKNTVFFKANAARESKHDESGRDYGGSIDLFPESKYFKTEKMEKEVRDGVLRLVIPQKTVEEMEEEGVIRIGLD